MRRAGVGAGGHRVSPRPHGGAPQSGVPQEPACPEGFLSEPSAPAATCCCNTCSRAAPSVAFAACCSFLLLFLEGLIAPRSRGRRCCFWHPSLPSGACAGLGIAGGQRHRGSSSVHAGLFPCIHPKGSRGGCKTPVTCARHCCNTLFVCERFGIASSSPGASHNWSCRCRARTAGSSSPRSTWLVVRPLGFWGLTHRPPPRVI